MNKVYNVVGKIVLGVCLYGVYRKTYDWGSEYIKKDVDSILEVCDMIKDSVKNKLNKEA